MFYIIPNAYEPGTAATNRMMALLHSLDKLHTGVQITTVFFEPNKTEDRINERYDNITIRTLWHKGERRGSKILLRLKTLYRQRRFFNSLKEGDTLLFSGYPHLLGMFLRKKGVHIYHEMNEHPSVIPLGPRGQHISIDKYLKWCRQLDGLFVISTQLTDYFVEKGVNIEKIHLYKMTVDPGRFVSIEKQPQDIPYLAYCGTVSNFKDGVDILLRAFALVKKEYNKPLKLRVIGKVPSETEKAGNLKLIEELEVSEDVVLTGMIKPEVMPQMLKNAEATVLARPDNIQAKYGFPTKLGEYLLASNPVIVTAVGDIPLYLKDGESALIAEPSNPQAVADKILWVLRHPQEGKDIGARGCQVALDNFNSDAEAKHVLNIITPKRTV